MSRQVPRQPGVAEIVTDQTEIAAAEARYRQRKQTALGRLGPVIVADVPVPLLAQYVSELPADECRVFLNELLARLPEELANAVLPGLLPRVKPEALPDRPFAEAWGRLARLLGLAKEQALFHLRLSFIEMQGGNLSQRLVSSRAESGVVEPMAEYERAIEEELATWDPTLQQGLAICESDFFASYRKATFGQEG